MFPALFMNPKQRGREICRYFGQDFRINLCFPAFLRGDLFDDEGPGLPPLGSTPDVGANMDDADRVQTAAQSPAFQFDFGAGTTLGGLEKADDFLLFSRFQRHDTESNADYGKILRVCCPFNEGVIFWLVSFISHFYDSSRSEFFDGLSGEAARGKNHLIFVLRAAFHSLNIGTEEF